MDSFATLLKKKTHYICPLTEARKSQQKTPVADDNYVHTPCYNQHQATPAQARLHLSPHSTGGRSRLRDRRRTRISQTELGKSGELFCFGKIQHTSVSFVTLTMQTHTRLFFHKNFCRKQKPSHSLADANAHVGSLCETTF